MQRILLIGKNGQLGWELQHILTTLGEVFAYDFPDIDLGKPKSVRDLIRNISPNLVINAAAYTNVDKAESEPDLARAINAEAPGLIAEETKRLKAAFIHYSTDYVFDGRKGSPYVETDLPNPLNIYGKTKLDGERFVQDVGGAYLIFRTSWVYSLLQGGFVAKVLHWAREQETMKIVNDQIGSPTWARMLAENTAKVIKLGKEDLVGSITKMAGLYHLAGGGSTTRFGWAKAIVELDAQKEEQVVREILPTDSSEFLTPAIRPVNTELDCTKFIQTYSISLPYWKTSLELMMGSKEKESKKSGN
jgi:dTDP-4-dehydrorhamnose reductase